MGIPSIPGQGNTGLPSNPGRGLFGQTDPWQRASTAQGLFGLGGGMLQGLDQSQQSANNAALSRQQIAAGVLQNSQGNVFNQQQLQQQNQQIGLQASQMDPLAQQKSRQQQALLAAILPGLRNASVSSPIAGMNNFIPQISGGLRIPEGGFDASTLQFFSPEARASAEASFYRAASPFMRAPNADEVGYGTPGDANSPGFSKNLEAQGLYDQGQQSSQARMAALMAALQQASSGYQSADQAAAKAAKGPSTAKKILGTLAGLGTSALGLFV